MTEHELLRIIAFLERVRLPFQELVPIAEEDATWNMLLYLVRSHLSGTPVAISTLASVAKVPHATAMRRIHALIERGDIVTRTASDTGKRFQLLPSEALLDSFIHYARKIKSLLAETFGLRPKTDSDEDFYFGGSYFAAQIIPPPRLIESLFRGKREIKFLLNDDNYFLSMRNMWADFRNNMASRTEFRSAQAAPAPRTPDREFAAGGLRIRHRRVQRALARRGGEEESGDPAGFPYPGRRDLAARFPSLGLVDGDLARAAVRDPDLLHHRTARRAQRSLRKGPARLSQHLREDDRRRPAFPCAGQGALRIAWNGGRGMPIASTFMFLMGCCGELILRIPKSSLVMSVDEARGEQLRPQIQSEAGLRVLDYLHKLRDVSPPDILEMDWDRRTTSFLSGQTALAYCWTVRAARFETDVSSAVKRRVSYLPQPRGPGAPPTIRSAASCSASRRICRPSGSTSPSRRSPG